MTIDLLLEPTDEQRMMVETAVRVPDADSPLHSARAAAERAEGGDAKLRRKLGDVGCFGLLVDEPRGGGSASGNGVVDAAMIAAECGARLRPGPFVGTSVTAYTLSRVGGAAPQPVLDAVASGASVGFGGPGTGVSVRADGEVPVLDGLIEAVQDVDECAHPTRPPAQAG